VFFAVGIAGIVQAKEKVLDKSTTQPRKEHIMKLVQYQRPALAWPAFGRCSSLQDEIDRLFESSVTAWAPALDVREDKDSFSVRVELPGLKREDISVQIEEGALVITGERKEEKIEEGTAVHRQERYYGKFTRALTLTTAVVEDKVTAQYKDGVLTVTLPKAEEVKPKAITVSE
jgi:HSP20 family protein